MLPAWSRSAVSRQRPNTLNTGIRYILCISIFNITNRLKLTKLCAPSDARCVYDNSSYNGVPPSSVLFCTKHYSNIWQLFVVVVVVRCCSCRHMCCCRSRAQRQPCTVSDMSTSMYPGLLSTQHQGALLGSVG